MLRLLVAATVGRTGVFLVPIGLFFVAAKNPDGAGGALALASIVTIARGLVLWPAGRLLDRVGPWRGLRTSIGAAAVCLAALSAVNGVAAPAWLQALAAALAGGLMAPIVATPRALLPDLVAAGRLPRASAWEAATIELSLLAAPLLGALLSRAGAQSVLIGAAVALTVSWVAMPRGTEPCPRARAADAGPLLTGRVLGLSVLVGLIGLSGGVLEPGLAALPPPLPTWHESAALLFVALSVGSFVGGVVSARIGWPDKAGHALPLLLLHAVPLAAAVGLHGGPGRLLTLVVAGLPFAPLVSLAGLFVDRWAAPLRRTETYAVIVAALEVGTGLGQALAGRLLAVAGPATLVLLSALPPVLTAAIVAVASRHRGALQR